jgi:hypothetical protein
LFFLAAPIGAAKEADKETVDLHKAAKDLKKLVKGMIDYQDTFGFLPPIGYGTGFGKDDPKEQAFAFRYLSWRVALMPFIEKKVPLIYRRIESGYFDPPLTRKTARELWKAQVLLKERPAAYAGGKKTKNSTTTTWRVFVGSGAAFEKDRLTKLPKDFPDGVKNTILIVEASEAVTWTKPDELLYDPKKPLPKLGGRFKEGFLAGFADGSVRLIPYKTDEKVLRALITRNGGEKIGKLPGRVIKVKLD